MPNCDVRARQSARQVDKHRSFSIITRKVGTRILRASAHDIRFPTSLTLDGSAAMTRSPDYSAAYAIPQTATPGLLALHAFTSPTVPPTHPCAGPRAAARASGGEAVRAHRSASWGAGAGRGDASACS